MTFVTKTRVVGLAVLLCSATTLVGWTAEDPATVEQAAAVWNGMTWAVPKGAEPQRRVAGITYETDGDAKSAFAFQQKQLLDAQWTELPDAYISDQSASGTFRKGAFTLSLMTFSTGKENQVNVALSQHGNVDLSKLPVPQGAKLLYSGPVSIMYVTETAADKAADAVAAGLTKLGWQPYGEAGEQRFYKRNAVRLSAYVSVAPAQMNKTMMTYSAELMSADLPAPRVTNQLQYADTTKQISFDTAETEAEIEKFYRETLAKAGWKPNIDKVTKIGFRNTMFFGNAAKDLLTLEMHNFEGKTRVQLKHQTAAEVREQMDREDAAAKARAAANKPMLSDKLGVTLPAAAKEVKVSASEIEFTTAAGQAKAAALSVAATLKKGGWKAGEQATEDMAGTLIFNKQKQTITILYVGTGFLPAEVTITGIGVELERAVEK